MKERTICYEYFEVDSLPVGDIPYSAIHKALKNEKYFRLFTPTYCRNDLKAGHLSALLYWYPKYIDQLYDLAVSGEDFMLYFNGLPIEIIEAFDYLFPETKKRLDKAKEYAVKLTELEEIKIKVRKV